MRTFLRCMVAIAVIAAAVVYWNFGTLTPCGMLREAIRQRGDLAAVLPDGMIDFGLEAQFGEMSPDRCFVILLKQPNPTNVDDRAGVPITVHATARTATSKAKAAALSGVRWSRPCLLCVPPMQGVYT
jgi:hypothetical protein